jgi:hypothetical protein
MGVKVEGMNPKEFQAKLREGAYDERIAKEEW